MQTVEQLKPTAISNALVTKVKAWLGEGLRQSLLLPAITLITPLQVRGLENLQKQNGPFIFAANHSSHLDTPLLLAALPLRLRLQVQVAAASDYFFNAGWKGALFSLLVNAFPFVRNGPNSANSLYQAKQLLQSGRSLIIFPEGTRTPDGNIHPFKHGIGRLVQGTTTQIVPIWIEGTWAAMPKGVRWPRRQQITITFGKPLSFTSHYSPAEITAIVEQQVKALAGQVNFEAKAA